MSTANRIILSNARLILPTETIEGSLVIEDGTITDVLPNRTVEEGLDLHGEFLAPGLVDSHTDYLERELQPRPDTFFPIELAFHLMDLRAIGCGVTTVLGAARISEDKDGAVGTWRGDGVALIEHYVELSEHALGRYYVHIRWDPNFEPCEDAIACVRSNRSVIGNLVFNESIPGERQFKNTFDNQVKRQAIARGVSEEEMRRLYSEQAAKGRLINNRPKVAAEFAGDIPLGSHDDTTAEHVIQAFENGCTLAEMPVTLEAARKAKELGMLVCMGSPNYYRGKSHCGNLSCRDAISEGLVDMLCSDYHFPSMLGSVVKMMEDGMPPHNAFAFVSSNPAKHLGLDHKLGSIKVGLAADLLSFGTRKSFGMVSRVWVEGRNVLDLAGRSF